MERWVIYLIIVVFALTMLNKQLQTNEFFTYITSVYEYILSFGIIGKVLTTLSIAIATVLSISFGIAEIAVSALFPVYESITMIFLGRIAGALVSYWLITKFPYLRSRAQQWLMTNPYIESMGNLIKESQYKYVLLLRLSNLPAPLKNYGLAIIGVAQKCYTICSMIEVAWMSLVKVFIGRQVHSAIGSYQAQGTLSIDGPGMAISAGGILILLYLSYKIYSDVERVKKATTVEQKSK